MMGYKWDRNVELKLRDAFGNNYMYGYCGLVSTCLNQCAGTYKRARFP